MLNKLLGLTFLMVTTTAVAQPMAPAPAPSQPAPGQLVPSATFSSTTTFEGCRQSWAFACNKRTADGRTYGTAHPVTHCTTYVFRPDGTYTTFGSIPVLQARGTYRLDGRKLKLTQPDDQQGTRTFELTLSSDGASIGDLKRKP